MNRKEAGVVLDSRRYQGDGWSDAFGDRRYRHSRSTTVVPHLGSKSTLVWRRDEPSQSSKLHTLQRGLVEDEALKPKTSQSLPSAASSLHTWKRIDIESKHPKQATDRSYRHTYGDRRSSPFEIEIKKDFPKIKQKPDVPNSIMLPAESTQEKATLPDVLVTKIYSKLHDEQPTQEDKDCVYVIKNMRKTTPASKSVNLPTVIPFYNIHLVKSVRKVMTQELFQSPPDEMNLMRLRRPMASERKYYSQISGNLLRSRKKLAYSSNQRDEDTNEPMPEGRAYRSAEVYNKLLALKHANKLLSAAEDPAESCPPTSSKLRHAAPKVTFKCDIKEDIASSTSTKEGREVSPPSVSTPHVTSVKVSRRGTKQPHAKKDNQMN